MDIRQSKFWQIYLEKLGWKIINMGGTRVYVRKILFGSVIKIPKANPPINFNEIEKIAKKEKSFFVKIEPNVTVENKNLGKTLKSKDFTEDSWSLQPTKTLEINLVPTEEELLKNMEKDTRYSIRRSQREGVVVEKSQDIETFVSLHVQTSKRQRFWVSTRDSKSLWNSLPEENKTILFAKKNGEILAGAFLIFYNEKAYYYQAGSTAKKRELLAPYLVVWESIKLAKEKGCEKFDFEGIEDKRIKVTKKWKGFTHFKRGFGGYEIEYLGSFVKYYNPVVKLIFSFNRFF